MMTSLKMIFPAAPDDDLSEVQVYKSLEKSWRFTHEIYDERFESWEDLMFSFLELLDWWYFRNWKIHEDNTIWGFGLNSVW